MYREVFGMRVHGYDSTTRGQRQKIWGEKMEPFSHVSVARCRTSPPPRWQPVEHAIRPVSLLLSPSFCFWFPCLELRWSPVSFLLSFAT